WPGINERPSISSIETRLRLMVRRNVASFRGDLEPFRVFEGLYATGQLPDRDVYSFDENRQSRVSFENTDTGQVELGYEKDYSSAGVPLDRTGLAKRLAMIRGHADAIQARGGKVIFFQMISSGRVRKVEEQRFPSAAYWEL